MSLWVDILGNDYDSSKMVGKIRTQANKKEEQNSSCFGYLCVWLCLLLCVCTVILPEQKEQKVSIVYVFLLFFVDKSAVSLFHLSCASVCGNNGYTWLSCMHINKSFER